MSAFLYTRVPAVVAALVLVGGVAPSMAGDELTPLEKKQALEKLDDLRKKAGGFRSGRLGVAIQAYQTAVASNDAAMDLYLKCLEKVRFSDGDGSSNNFREWKRQNKDRLADVNLRTALRHQLRWLLLGLQFGDQEPNAEVSTKASQALRDIFADVKDLASQVGVLREGVFHSVFAQAYDIGEYAPRSWPNSPLPAATVFETLILPPLRTPATLASLRSAWTARIEMEAREIEMEPARNRGPMMPGRRNNDNNNRDETEARMERFLTERRPDLLWAMQVDLFQAGGQKEAVEQMLVTIEGYLGHRKALDWAADLHGLLTTEVVDAGAEGGDKVEEPAPAPPPDAIPPSALPPGVVQKPPAGPARPKAPDAVPAPPKPEPAPPPVAVPAPPAEQPTTPAPVQPAPGTEAAPVAEPKPEAQPAPVAEPKPAENAEPAPKPAGGQGAEPDPFEAAGE